MATLNKKQKLFIVRSLAQFNTPQETVLLVKEEFTIDVSRQQCEAYDPTKRVGKDLSAELKAEFEATRKDFLEAPQNIPIANLTVRLQRLENQYQKHGKNRVAALSILSKQQKTWVVNIPISKKLQALVVAHCRVKTLLL
jgi:hypothetical protein